LRAYDTANRLGGKTAALLLASLIVLAAGSPDAGIAIAAGAEAGAIQEQINFTRSNEEEADTVGIKILAKSNFDPRAMPLFFERMTHATRLYESGIPEILRTHPVTTNRIADALGRAEAYPYKQYTGSLSYFLIREMLRMRSFKAPADAVKHFATGLREGRYLNQEAHEYGHALALTANNQQSKAEPIIEKLLKKRSDQAEYILASAHIANSLKNSDKAIKILDTYHSLMPDNYPISVVYIENLTDSGRLKEARAVAKQTLSLFDSDPRLYKLLSRIEGLDGRKTESHRVLAEAYIATGEYERAIQQLEVALKAAGRSDFYQTSRIESQLQKLRALSKAQRQRDRH
jgi:predicted Zn-dependent protease